MSQATICDHCGERIITGIQIGVKVSDAAVDAGEEKDYHNYCSVLRNIADLPAESQLKVRNARGKWTKLGSGKQQTKETVQGHTDEEEVSEIEEIDPHADKDEDGHYKSLARE